MLVISLAVKRSSAVADTDMLHTVLKGSVSLNQCYPSPREWLIDVLSRIPEYNNDYSMDLAELLPHRWKAPENLQKTTE